MVENFLWRGEIQKSLKKSDENDQNDNFTHFACLTLKILIFGAFFLNFSIAPIFYPPPSSLTGLGGGEVETHIINPCVLITVVILLLILIYNLKNPSDN